MAKGLDVGTCFLVAAQQDPTGMTDGTIKSIRDAFIDLEDSSPGIKTSLKMSKVDFIEDGSTLYVLGDAALRTANLLKREVRRPMSKGVISPGERDSEKILYLLLREVLGTPSSPNEIVYYSVPAEPIDADFDVTYHEAVFKKVIENFGYRAYPMNEAVSIAYSECADSSFSGLCVSCGSGQSNVALVYQTIPGMQFSIAHGGDFIDEGAAKAVGKTSAQIMSIKERGVNLLDPTDGDPKYFVEREAIQVFYKNLIRKIVASIKDQFKGSGGMIDVTEPIPLVISGGTSLAGGFLELFTDEINKIKDFPIPISEIRLASDQLNAVAKGLLIAAINEEA